MYLLMGTRHSFSISGLAYRHLFIICLTLRSRLAFFGARDRFGLALGSVHVFGLDWILAGIRIGRDERAGWLLDYTLATVFDVACWADGTEGSEAKG